MKSLFIIQLAAAAVFVLSCSKEEVRTKKNRHAHQSAYTSPTFRQFTDAGSDIKSAANTAGISEQSLKSNLDASKGTCIHFVSGLTADTKSISQQLIEYLN